MLVPEVIQPSAVEAVQRAEVDVQINTAHRFPRQIGRVKQEMLSYATLDQDTAEGCFYSLPRGGKNIQGPSVRLAEIAASCYGNLRVGSRVISTETGGSNPHVIIQAIAHDLEKNVAVTMEKRRRIVGKKSKGGMIDEDDINLATNACAAIAFRDAVFKVVPLALIKPVMEQAKRVAIGDATTLVARRDKCMATFTKMGVTKERVLAAVEKRSVEEIGLEQLETLIGIYTAIKDGASTVDDAFPAIGVTAPKFGPTIPPATTDAPKRGPGRPRKTPEPVPVATAPEEQPIVTVRRLCSEAGVPEALLVGYLRTTGQVDDSLTTLDDVNTVSPEALVATIGAWADIQKDEAWVALVNEAQNGGAK